MISTLEMRKRNGHPLVVEIKQTSGVLDSAFLVVSENCQGFPGLSQMGPLSGEINGPTLDHELHVDHVEQRWVPTELIILIMSDWRSTQDLHAVVSTKISFKFNVRCFETNSFPQLRCLQGKLKKEKQNRLQPAYSTTKFIQRINTIIRVYQ